MRIDPEEANSPIVLQVPAPQLATGIERDPVYFCENVVLKAEDRIFSVPKYGLMEHGTYFQTLFEGNATRHPTRGSSELHPLILEGVSKTDFHNFLRVLYPFHGIDSPCGDDDWLGVLDLSTKWGFHEIREIALTNLEHLFATTSHHPDPVYALYLCKKYNIKQHIKHQYETLITCVLPLDCSAMLAGGLDDDTIRQVYELRDRWLCGLMWGPREAGRTVTYLPYRVSAKTIIEEYFADLADSSDPDSITSSATEDAYEEDQQIASENEWLQNTAIYWKAVEEVAIEEDRKREEEERESYDKEQDDPVLEMEAQPGQESVSVELSVRPRDEDDLDDTQFASSGTHAMASLEVRARVGRMVTVMEKKWQLEKQVEELRREGFNENHLGMKELIELVEKHKQMLATIWKQGVEQAYYEDDDEVILLESSNQVESRLKIDERLERLLHPNAKSLSFTVQIQLKNPEVIRQKKVIAEIGEYYALSPYRRTTLEENHRLYKIKIPEEDFGGWLVEVKRLWPAQRQKRLHTPSSTLTELNTLTQQSDVHMSFSVISETSICTKDTAGYLSYSEIDNVEVNMKLDLDETKPPVVPEATQLETGFERDPVYFCENVVFKAEDRMFCVPKSGLIEHGTYFQTLFDGLPAKGTSELHPIILEGVSKIHFHNFLRLIYPFRGIDSPSGDEHWLGILDLATKWGFNEIRKIALINLEHLFVSPSPQRDPIYALYLCKKYDIQQHVKHQFEALIMSITPIDRSAMFAGGIDEDTILQLSQLREKWLCGLIWGKEGSGTGAGGFLPRRLSAKMIVEDHFANLTGDVAATTTTEDMSAEILFEDKRLKETVSVLKSLEEAVIEEERKHEAEQALVEKERGALDEALATQETHVEGSGGEHVGAVDLFDISSEISVTPSPEVHERVERLILLREQQYQSEKLVQELRKEWMGEENSLLNVHIENTEKHKRKLVKIWEKVPPEKFGEWLVEFKKVWTQRVSEPGPAPAPMPYDPWA
ncbi:hypothetical protein CVT24_010831 [Panaeolus cyanescens]|uniref:BTB domain-containing protein n=1 Tax=Panaeolus cyanescens TaxID=181874 RepID=A0A409VH32_9AGAR|nr:hypothetical protein CVT24_010831 [Panaeolus cyanescens]